MSSEWRDLLRQVRRNGGEVVVSSHIKIYREGKLVVTLPKSPGGGRSYLNNRACLRQEGLVS